MWVQYGSVSEVITFYLVSPSVGKKTVQQRAVVEAMLEDNRNDGTTRTIRTVSMLGRCAVLSTRGDSFDSMNVSHTQYFGV